MRANLLTALILLLFSCENRVEEKVDFSNKEAFPRVKLPDDYFYDYKKLDSPYYKIKWGHKLKDTLTTDTTYELLGSGTMGYLTSNKNAIMFEQGCGTGCNYIAVLPFDRNIKPKLLFECIAIDTANNLVAYVTEETKAFIEIENYLTGERMLINENTCDAAIKINCVESCYFDNGFFYLRWFDAKYDLGKNSHKRTKKYSVSNVVK